MKYTNQPDQQTCFPITYAPVTLPEITPSFARNPNPVSRLQISWERVITLVSDEGFQAKNPAKCVGLRTITHSQQTRNLWQTKHIAPNQGSISARRNFSVGYNMGRETWGLTGWFSGCTILLPPEGRGGRSS